MREVSWVALLRHIPPEQQDGLMLITKAGTEITIEIVRGEERLSITLTLGKRPGNLP